MGPAPKCRRSAFWEGPERSLRGVLCRGSQTCFGRNRDPEGAQNAKQKTECRRAPERPRSCDRAKDGIHNGRHAREQNSHLHTGCGKFATKAAGFEHADPPQEGEVRQRRSRSVAARSPALPSQGTGGKASRISSRKGHESASGTVGGPQLIVRSAGKRTMARPRGQTEGPD